MDRWSTFAIILIAILVILIALFLIIQYRLASVSQFPFTYGDKITIQNLATGDFLVPSCSLIGVPYAPTNLSTTNSTTPGGVGVPILAASNSRPLDTRSQVWQIVIPPTIAASNAGYVFKNTVTGGYMFFTKPPAGLTPSYILVAPPALISDGVVTAATLYADSRTVFNITLSDQVVTNSANNNVYNITHYNPNLGVEYSFYTTGLFNAASTPAINATTRVPAPCAIAFSNGTAQCTGSDPICINAVSIANRTLSNSRVSYRITKVT